MQCLWTQLQKGLAGCPPPRRYDRFTRGRRSGRPPGCRRGHSPSAWGHIMDKATVCYVCLEGHVLLYLALLALRCGGPEPANLRTPPEPPNAVVKSLLFVSHTSKSPLKVFIGVECCLPRSGARVRKALRLELPLQPSLPGLSEICRTERLKAMFAVLWCRTGRRSAAREQHHGLPAMYVFSFITNQGMRFTLYADRFSLMMLTTGPCSFIEK